MWVLLIQRSWGVHCGREATLRAASGGCVVPRRAKCTPGRESREDEGGEEWNNAVDYHAEDFVLGESAAEATAYLNKAVDDVSQ